MARRGAVQLPVQSARCAVWPTAIFRHAAKPFVTGGSGDARNAAALVFFLFDLLYLDGEPIGPLLLIERKERLRQLLPTSSQQRRYNCDISENAFAVTPPN
jgi:hypothetical protein